MRGVVGFFDVSGMEDLADPSLPFRMCTLYLFYISLKFKCLFFDYHSQLVTLNDVLRHIS